MGNLQTDDTMLIQSSITSDIKYKRLIDLLCKQRESFNVIVDGFESMGVPVTQMLEPMDTLDIMKYMSDSTYRLVLIRIIDAYQQSVKLQKRTLFRMKSIGLAQQLYYINQNLTELDRNMQNLLDKKETIRVPYRIAISEPLTYAMFLGVRRKSEHISKQAKRPGAYILENTTIGKYYVGQSVNIINRVHEHFLGTLKGNQDVFADFTKDDIFLIRLVDCDSDLSWVLNQLEKDLIAKYDSYHNGYNKNSGNS